MKVEATPGIDSIYQLQLEQTGQISQTIENILGSLEADTVLKAVQAEWGEGNMRHIIFEQSGFSDAEYSPHALGRMRVGVSLETDVPVIVGHYDREYRW